MLPIKDTIQDKDRLVPRPSCVFCLELLVPKVSTLYLCNADVLL